MLITIITLVLAAAGFVWGRIRADVVALIALLILTLSGILTTQEALSGFSNPIVIMMVGLFVVGGAIFNTGLAKNGRCASVASWQRQSDTSLPRCCPCHRTYRRIRQQYGHRGINAPHRSLNGGFSRSIRIEVSYAACIRLKHRRNAYPHRYTAKPCHCWGLGGIQRRTSHYVLVSPYGSNMSRSWHFAPHPFQQNAFRK